MLRVSEANRPGVTEDFIEWFLDGCEDHRVLYALAAMGMRPRLKDLSIDDLRYEFENFGFTEEEVCHE
jgi:hypothetical protein